MTVTRTSFFSGPYVGDGTATTFAITFQAASEDEVSATLNGTPISPAAFNVNLNDDGTGSAVFFVAPIGSVVLYSNPSFTQAVNFEDQGPFYQSSVNEPIDRSAIRDIFLLGILQRAVTAPIGEELGALPSAQVRAGKVLAFDVNGNPVAVATQISLSSLDLLNSIIGLLADASVTGVQPPPGSGLYLNGGQLAYA